MNNNNNDANDDDDNDNNDCDNDNDNNDDNNDKINKNNNNGGKNDINILLPKKSQKKSLKYVPVLAIIVCFFMCSRGQAWDIFFFLCT